MRYCLMIRLWYGDVTFWTKGESTNILFCVVFTVMLCTANGFSAVGKGLKVQTCIMDIHKLSVVINNVAQLQCTVIFL